MCLDNSLSNIRNFRLNGFMNGRLRLPMCKYMNIPKVFFVVITERRFHSHPTFTIQLQKYTLLLYYWATFFQNQMYLETTYYLFSVRSNKNPTSELLNDFLHWISNHFQTCSVGNPNFEFHKFRKVRPKNW